MQYKSADFMPGILRKQVKKIVMAHRLQHRERKKV